MCPLMTADVRDPSCPFGCGTLRSPQTACDLRGEYQSDPIPLDDDETPTPPVLTPKRPRQAPTEPDTAPATAAHSSASPAPAPIFFAPLAVPVSTHAISRHRDDLIEQALEEGALMQSASSGKALVSAPVGSSLQLQLRIEELECPKDNLQEQLFAVTVDNQRLEEEHARVRRCEPH